MKTKSLLSILALAGCLLPNAVHAGTCDATIANLVSWLKQDVNNNVTATVVANRPPSWVLQAGSLPSGASEVTYTNVGLQPSGWVAAGGLFAPTPGSLFYDDRFWYQSLLPHPFDPNHTDSFGLLITATGTAYVYPANGAQSFAATCTAAGDVMYGQPTTALFGTAPPFYSITFTKWVKQVIK